MASEFSKIIMIVGCSRGIGYRVVEQLSQDKGNLIIALSRKIDGLTALSSHGNIVAHSVDLESANVRGQVEAILDPYPRIDVLINNAGCLIKKPFLDITRADLNRCYSVHIFSVIETVQAVFPKMEHTGGHIVNIGSMGGFQGSVKFGGLMPYSTSKAAMSSFTEMFSAEYPDSKVVMNCLCLGAAQTELLEEAFPGYVAPMSAAKMAEYVVNFSLTAHQWMRGKIIPVSCSTP
jgi:3-oxoacyl-[acyl-carrier protein] reductase